jgi:chaperonin GroEL
MSEISELKFQSDARKRMVAGVHQLATAVSVTLGPKGKNVAIIRRGQRPHLTKDGVTVANSINLKDSFENLGCQVVKEAAQRSADVAGDGTTTATVIAANLLDQGHSLLETGHDARQVVVGIEMACNEVLQELEKSRVDLDTSEQLKSIAVISANGEETVGNLIAEAIEKVGPDGPITVENAKGFNTHLDVVEGTVIDRGYLSPYFATDKSKGLAELEKVQILLCNQVLSSAKMILPFLEHAASSNSALLIVANDVANDALQTLVLNRMKGTLNVCAIKAPEFGNARSQALEDLAAVTGGAVLTGEEQITKTDNLSEFLGYADKVITDKHGTLLIGTRGDKDDVKCRVENLSNELSQPGLKENEAGLLKRRVRRLSEGIAIIRVGGATEGEMFERRDRVDDALCAAKSAKRSGIQPGGGTALMQASKTVASRKSKIDNDSCEAGYQALLKSCITPLTQIVQNAGEVPEIVTRKLKRTKRENYGYDARTAEYGDMLEMKIIDPHDVVVSALTHAASVVCNILMIGCAISITESEGGESLGLLEEL